MTDREQGIIEITDPDSDRYAVLRLIDWWDQARLAKARVMVVGAGALGNEAVKNLTLLGVGKIVVVDFDHVEVSNLSRSVFFRVADAGRLKAETIAARARELNPEIEIIPIIADVTTDLGLGVFRRMDVVIGCLDNREARMAVNRACWRVGVPWVDGGLDVLDGQVRVFVPPAGACYECTLSERDYELMQVRYTCPPGAEMPAGRYPTTATAASIIAAMQTQEAIKLLHGLPVIDGRGAVYSGQTLHLTTIHYPVRPECPAHQSYGPIIELPHRAAQLTLNELLALSPDGVLAPDHPILTHFDCYRCQRREMIFRPYHLAVTLIACSNCGQDRQFDVAPALPASPVTRDVTLAQLGVPPLHIVRVRSARGWEYFELSADAADVLPFAG